MVRIFPYPDRFPVCQFDRLEFETFLHVYVEDITRRREDMTFYLRVVKTIFYERAQRVGKILFLTREDKSHIFKPPCNVLFIIQAKDCINTKSHVIDKMENMSLCISQYLTLYYIIKGRYVKKKYPWIIFKNKKSWKY